MSELSKETKELIAKYKIWEKSSEFKESISNIHVDEVASRVASFYEKIRGIIDWKEEHLLKRSALERSLRRRIFPQMNIGEGKKITSQISAESLVLELIRSGHFPNNEIEERKIVDVQRIIDKYIRIINESSVDENDSLVQFLQWITSIAACEIEETLTPSIKEQALMDFMYFKLKEYVFLGNDAKKEVDESEMEIQIFINIRKALFDLDQSVISYHLIKYKYSSWVELSESDERMEIVIRNIHGIRREIEAHLNHQLSGKINQLCQKYNTPFLILGDIISENPSTAEKSLSEPTTFEFLIRDKYAKRLNDLSLRLRRAAFYSTVSIFLTNIITLFAVEIPISRYFGHFTVMGYLVTILVPTVMMALLVVTIPLPPKGNLEKVVIETIKIAYVAKQKKTYEIKKFKKRGPVFGFVISVIYSISFLISVGFIVWALTKIQFPPFSHPIFIIFLALIAFAGVKIREKAKELHMIDKKEGFFTIVVDFFALPIVLFGKWLTLRWKRLNVVSVFFNALIDMPFSLFVEFLEQWRYFLKEKRERL